MAFNVGPFPIDWFGDRPIYEESEIRVVTVGINPSNNEFGGDLQNPSLLRFPNAKNNNKASQIQSFNEYFKQKPYSWFTAFEKVLNGMDVSYFDGKGIPNRAIHTDIGSNEATNPTWGKLSKQEQTCLFAKGILEWDSLIRALSPDIIIGALSNAMINQLGLNSHPSKILTTISTTKTGSMRKRPIEIMLYNYKGIKFVNGVTRNVPFGSISDAEKNKIGKIISGLIP